MKKTKVGINGFGRFGLHLLKYWLDRAKNSNFAICYINDDSLSLDQALKIITSDESVVFNKYKFSTSKNNLNILEPGGARYTIEYSKKTIKNIPWLGKPEIVLECSGKATVSKEAEGYLGGKSNLVIISATSWDSDKTLIFGFNHKQFKHKLKVISYGSCTVNAYIPLANYLNNKYKILESDANFIHNVQKYKLEEFNTLNRKFCTLEKSAPNLLPFLNKNNFTVNYTVIPYAGVSMLDYRFKLKLKVSRDHFLEDLNQAVMKGELTGLYDLNEFDVGPEIYNCSTFSAVFIKENIRFINTNVYIHGYFDNENSVNRYYDLVDFICSNS